jgi:hypothetical protein
MRLGVGGHPPSTNPDLAVLLGQRPEIFDCGNLSPLSAPELMKPPAILSFQASENHGLDEVSANFLNCQAGPPIYVELP